MSCDLLPAETPGQHYQGDVRDLLDYPWDLMIAHPPCTHLSVSGARHFAEKRMDGRQQSAVRFFMALARMTDIYTDFDLCALLDGERIPSMRQQVTLVAIYQQGHDSAGGAPVHEAAVSARRAGAG